MSARGIGRILLASLACGGLGCPPAQGVEVPKPADGAVYEQYVQPYTAASCATLDCHGDPGRPLRMYSELGLRGDASLRMVSISELRPPQTLSAAEVSDNVTAFSSVSKLEDGTHHLALLKPLRGGIHHMGGKLWPNEQAPGYLCLRGWLAPSADTPIDTGESCALALDALGP